MRRVQRMIVAITKRPEKEERQRRCTIRKATLGYDTNKLLKTDVSIRGERNQQVDYEHLDIAPLTIGRHMFSHCQHTVSVKLCSRRFVPCGYVNVRPLQEVHNVAPTHWT